MESNNIKVDREFERLYKLFYPAVLNFVNQRLRDREASKEVVQDAMVKVWKKRFNIDLSEATFKSYLYTTARNTLIDYVRGRVNTESIDQDNVERIHVEEDEALINDSLLKVEIMKCLNKMKPKRKEIFMLSKMQGYTYKEIAAALDISERTVEDNISKALAALKAHLMPKKDLIINT